MRALRRTRTPEPNRYCSGRGGDNDRASNAANNATAAGRASHAASPAAVITRDVARRSLRNHGRAIRTIHNPSPNMAGRITKPRLLIMPSLQPQRRLLRMRLWQSHPLRRRSLRLFIVPAGGFADHIVCRSGACRNPRLLVGCLLRVAASDASDEMTAELAFQACFSSARQPYPNINSRHCLPLGPLERRRAVAGKVGGVAEDCPSCRLVQSVLSNSTASSTGAELAEQHRDTTLVAVNQGRPSLGYFSWPRKKSDQLPVCHRPPWIPAYAGIRR